MLMLSVHKRGRLITPLAASLFPPIFLSTPQAVQIAIFIYGNHLFTTSADLCFGFILEIAADASALGLDIDEDNVVLRKHRVCLATHLHLNLAIAQIGYYGDMLLATRLNRIGDKFLHLLATAYYTNARVNYLFNHIAAMAALVKFCCHKIV